MHKACGFPSRGGSRIIVPGMDDLLHRSALAQAQLIRDRSISSEEIVRFYCDRIARLDGSISSFVSVMRRSALRVARAKDRMLRDGAPLPPFHGVPIGVKDLNLMRGSFTRFGSRAWRWFVSPIDDETVRALRRGGFVILGKLATSEAGAMPVTEPDIHPPTRNPWDLGRTAGGSSGGSGAAVAAGLLPIAQGSDGAGSIRIPSSFCGLFGIKASRGRIPNSYSRVDPTGLSAMGPLARTVDDAAALFDVLAGRPTSLGPPPPLRALRIRFTTRAMLAPTDPTVVAATLATARALEALGHHVEEGAPIDGALDDFLPIYQRQLANTPVLSNALLQPATRWLREAGQRITRAQAAAHHRMLSERVLAWFGDADLWLTPTVGVLPPAIGAWRGLPAEE
jgi:amidase